MFDALFGGAPRQHANRAAERFETLGLSCGLGEVIDLSVSGMKVRCHKRPPIAIGDELELALASDSQRISLRGRVAWVKRQGLASVVLGIRFVGIRPGIASALEQLGRYGFISVEEPATGRSEARAANAPVRASMEIEDLYAILEVSSAATAAEIRTSYHRLAKLLHPDHNASPETGGRFANVAKAYRILRDETMRRRYDEMVATCTLSRRADAA